MKLFNSFRLRILLLFGVVGPGLITAFADNDAGGVATYSVAASKYGYNIFLTLIPITIVLLITQEIGGRIAVVTGKGLGDLIRERFGLRVSLLIFFLLLAVNFGVILQDLGGLKSALGLFHLNILVFLPVLIASLFYIVTNASYAKIEKFFLFLVFFYAAYIVSAFLARPDWFTTVKTIVIPYQNFQPGFIYTSIAVLGTTVTAWGQFFINSYVKDKKLTIESLKYNQLEIYVSAFLTNIVSLFIMVAVIATLWTHNIQINNASEAALAIAPLAGQFASLLFGFGLLVAGFIGAAVVPLATAYAFSEFFGYEGSLDVSFNKSRLFYGMFILQILAGLCLTLLPNFSLFSITIVADFLNGAFLPVVFFFLYKFANNKELMGSYRNSFMQNVLLVGAGVVITVACIIGLVSQYIHF
ncbi:MAG: NRAMP family divalent metal transporter [Candidatus Levyibacteriota bacterium]